MDPHVNHGHGKKRVEASGEAFPAHDQSAVLPLKPGKHPLDLEARDILFDRSPTRLAALPHPFRDLGPNPTCAEAMTKVFTTLRKGACGTSRPRAGGSGGKMPAKRFHSESLKPSNRPAIMPSHQGFRALSHIIQISGIGSCSRASQSSLTVNEPGLSGLTVPTRHDKAA
jgi:hypothetical protein